MKGRAGPRQQRGHFSKGVRGGAPYPPVSPNVKDNPRYTSEFGEAHLTRIEIRGRVG